MSLEFLILPVLLSSLFRHPAQQAIAVPLVPPVVYIVVDHEGQVYTHMNQHECLHREPSIHSHALVVLPIGEAQESVHDKQNHDLVEEFHLVGLVEVHRLGGAHDHHRDNRLIGQRAHLHKEDLFHKHKNCTQSKSSEKEPKVVQNEAFCFEVVSLIKRAPLFLDFWMFELVKVLETKPKLEKREHYARNEEHDRADVVYVVTVARPLE